MPSVVHGKEGCQAHGAVAGNLILVLVQTSNADMPVTAFAQMLGGIVASAILHALTPGALGVQARLSGGTSIARGLFIEMFATAGLTLSVLMLAAGELTMASYLWGDEDKAGKQVVNVTNEESEKHNLTPMAPLGVGLTLWVVMLWSIGFTGGSVK
jgi:aquaporin related protein